MAKVTLESLTFPQQRLLHRAAKRLDREGWTEAYDFIGRGQSATARKLESLGLGIYVQEPYFSRNEAGYDLIRTIPAEEGSA
jgi:hypothetical protein